MKKAFWITALLLLTLLAVFVLNASRPGRPEGCPQDCAVHSTRHPGALRLISFNMLHEFPHFTYLHERIAIIAAEIQRQDADIVLLQEVPWTWGTKSVANQLARQVGFNFLFLRASGNRNAIFFEEGSAILSRFPLEQPSGVELKPQEALFEHRIALHAVVVTPWGDLDLFVTHLANDKPGINLRQTRSLADYVESTRRGAALVAGDFNAQEETIQIQGLSRAWVDAYRNLHPSDPGWTCCIDDLRADPEEPFEERIDYIFLLPSDGWRLLSAERAFHAPFPFESGWLWASDHVGLVVQLER